MGFLKSALTLTKKALCDVITVMDNSDGSGDKYVLDKLTNVRDFLSLGRLTKVYDAVGVGTIMRVQAWNDLMYVLERMRYAGDRVPEKLPMHAEDWSRQTLRDFYEFINGKYTGPKEDTFELLESMPLKIYKKEGKTPKKERTKSAAFGIMAAPAAYYYILKEAGVASAGWAKDRTEYYLLGKRDDKLCENIESGLLHRRSRAKKELKLAKKEYTELLKQKQEELSKINKQPSNETGGAQEGGPLEDVVKKKAEAEKEAKKNIHNISHQIEILKIFDKYVLGYTNPQINVLIPDENDRRIAIRYLEAKEACKDVKYEMRRRATAIASVIAAAGLLFYAAPKDKYKALPENSIPEKENAPTPTEDDATFQAFDFADFVNYVGPGLQKENMPWDEFLGRFPFLTDGSAIQLHRYSSADFYTPQGMAVTPLTLPANKGIDEKIYNEIVSSGADFFLVSNGGASKTKPETLFPWDAHILISNRVGDGKDVAGSNNLVPEDREWMCMVDGGSVAYANRGNSDIVAVFDPKKVSSESITGALYALSISKNSDASDKSPAKNTNPVPSGGGDDGEGGRGGR